MGPKSHCFVPVAVLGKVRARRYGLVIVLSAVDTCERHGEDGAGDTHKQSSIINVNADGLPETSVKCFCVMGDDKLLAGCEGPATEIRVFDAGGKFVKPIELPVTPEATNVATDGSILFAGEGKLLRVAADGKVLAEADALHASGLPSS